MISEARKKATELAIAIVSDILPNTENGNLTRRRLDSLTDKEFEELMLRFQTGQDYLQIFTPIADDKYRLNIDNLHAVGKKYNIEFYQRIWMPEEDGSWELSNKKSMVIYLPLRVQQQLVEKKVSIPKNNRHSDALTRQATGKESKGARISYPEVNAFLSMGLVKTSEEYLHFRGGSENGMRLIEQSIAQQGFAKADSLKPYTGTVGATTMLHSYLTAMMLKSTLLNKTKY